LRLWRRGAGRWSWGVGHGKRRHRGKGRECRPEVVGEWSCVGVGVGWGEVGREEIRGSVPNGDGMRCFWAGVRG